jgi:acyl-CoA thioester hydrolase
MTSGLRAYRHKVQYYETDQMGAVHHSNYIRWFEEARTDLLEQLGFGYDRMEARGVISPVLGVSCEYKVMVRYGETVRIACAITSFSGVRLTVAYRITDDASGELRATGESRHCFLDRNFKPQHMKRDHKDMCEMLQGMLGVEIGQ